MDVHAMKVHGFVDRDGNLRPDDCPLRHDLEPLIKLSDVIELLRAVPVGESRESNWGEFDALARGQA